MHEPGFDDDQPDWDYLMSKDNKTIEDLRQVLNESIYAYMPPTQVKLSC